VNICCQIAILEYRVAKLEKLRWDRANKELWKFRNVAYARAYRARKKLNGIHRLDKTQAAATV